jgi:hypothetical protein
MQTVVQPTLVEQAILLRSELHGCLERVESFLVRARAALGTFPVVLKPSSPTELNVDSADAGEEDLYGGFSPRAMPCELPQPNVADSSESEIMAPVMLVMPELQELHGESAPPLSMVHLEVDSLRPSSVASTPSSLVPSQPLVFVDSEILFAQELSDLLARLEKACPGSGKEIACLLSEKDTRDKIKKVQDYLGGRCKKGGVARKASAAA